MSVKYQIPASKYWAVLSGGLICHCKCHHFILLLETMTGPTLSPALSPLPSILLAFLFFLACVSAFPTWQMIAPVKVFSVSIWYFPKRGPKKKKEKGGSGGGWRGGVDQSFLQLVSLRKLFRIASFQGRLVNAYNPWLSAIVLHNLAIILCLFHLENPYPIKVIQPFQYLLPIKSGRYYLPSWNWLAPQHLHSLGLFNVIELMTTIQVVPEQDLHPPSQDQECPPLTHRIQNWRGNREEGGSLSDISFLPFSFFRIFSVLFPR